MNDKKTIIYVVIVKETQQFLGAYSTKDKAELVVERLLQSELDGKTLMIIEAALDCFATYNIV